MKRASEELSEWFREHPFPQNPTPPQALDWHLAALELSSCRDLTWPCILPIRTDNRDLTTLLARGIIADGQAAPEDHIRRERESGTRGLLVFCQDYKCGHNIKIPPEEVDKWPDDMRLSDLEPRFVCTVCGQRGALIRGDDAPPWGLTAHIDEVQRALTLRRSRGSSVNFLYSLPTPRMPPWRRALIPVHFRAFSPW